jgi:hypothetical protein
VGAPPLSSLIWTISSAFSRRGVIVRPIEAAESGAKREAPDTSHAVDADAHRATQRRSGGAVTHHLMQIVVAPRVRSLHSILVSSALQKIAVSET